MQLRRGDVDPLRDELLRLSLCRYKGKLVSLNNRHLHFASLLAVCMLAYFVTDLQAICAHGAGPICVQIVLYSLGDECVVSWHLDECPTCL